MISDLWNIGKFFLKQVWPFLREWLFKSRSVRAWMKVHAYHLFYLALLIVMLILCYRLFQAATTAHQLAATNAAERQKVAQKYEKLLQATKNSRAHIATLSQANKTLASLNHEQAVRITTYETWMQSCGMDYSNLNARIPACKNVATVKPSPPSRRPQSTQRKPKQQPKPKQQRVPEPKKDFAKQVQDLWGQQ